jgi:hypothetical protein
VCVWGGGRLSAGREGALTGMVPVEEAVAVAVAVLVDVALPVDVAVEVSVGVDVAVAVLELHGTTSAGLCPGGDWVRVASQGAPNGGSRGGADWTV